MQVFLLFLENNQSWQHQTKTLKGVFASIDDAVDAIDDWARNRRIEKSFNGIRYGADGVEYVIEPHTVRGKVNANHSG